MQCAAERPHGSGVGPARTGLRRALRRHTRGPGASQGGRGGGRPRARRGSPNWGALGGPPATCRAWHPEGVPGHRGVQQGPGPTQGVGSLPHPPQETTRNLAQTWGWRGCLGAAGTLVPPSPLTSHVGPGPRPSHSRGRRGSCPPAARPGASASWGCSQRLRKYRRGPTWCLGGRGSSGEPSPC